MAEHYLNAPDQQLDMPTHFPYNTRMQPRRLDYLCLKHLTGADGQVLRQRDLACSDHELVCVQLQAPSTRKTGKPATCSWGLRRMRKSDVVELILEQSVPRQQGDRSNTLPTLPSSLQSQSRGDRYRNSRKHGNSNRPAEKLSSNRRDSNGEPCGSP